MPESEAKCIEAGASVSAGGKIQIVKYEVQQDYHFSFNRKYSVPEDWNERDVEDFQISKAVELREQLEQLAQAEVDALLAEKERLA